MTEEEGKRWIADTFAVPRETMARLEQLAELVRAESAVQNLVSASSLDTMWSRHIADSAQLLPLLAPGHTLDIGSGAGFPGLVIAILDASPILLIEPRRKRAEFLAKAASCLGLAHVEVRQSRVESLDGATRFDTIVARAVAPLSRLFQLSNPVAHPDTRWILPKGRTVESELAAARETWHGDFRIVASVTDPDAAIVVAENVRRKTRREGAR